MEKKNIGPGKKTAITEVSHVDTGVPPVIVKSQGLAGETVRERSKFTMRQFTFKVLYRITGARTSGKHGERLMMRQQSGQSI